MAMIAITGATGFVGRYLVRELLRRGHSVRGLIRDGAKGREVFGSPAPAGLSFVIGDCCDERVLGDLVRGADAVVHLVGIIRESRGEDAARPQSFERMHVRATEAILGATQKAGIKRYLHMSALGAGAAVANGEGWGIGPITGGGASAYQRTKWEAEQSVKRSGLSWTIFRPGLIHGPDGEFVQVMGEITSGDAPPWVFIPYFAKTQVDHRVLLGAITFEPANVQPIAVEDVALAFANAIEKPESVQEVYNLCGPEVLNWRELSVFFRDTLPGANKRLGTWNVPGEHAAMIARGANAVGMGGFLPFDEGQALMATEDSVADVTKARVELGVTPRGFRETVQGYAGRV
ncbi:MAG: NAD(P)H-binding protein [Phycisphaerales bacterium]|nr:NAD(P)H-binding protein [Phycisphaerales bacterium]